MIALTSLMYPVALLLSTKKCKFFIPTVTGSSGAVAESAGSSELIELRFFSSLASGPINYVKCCGLAYSTFVIW